MEFEEWQRDEARKMRNMILSAVGAMVVLGLLYWALGIYG